MICGWRGNNSRVGAAHVLHYLSWCCECRGRHVGSRPLRKLAVLEYSYYHLNLQFSWWKNLHYNEIPRMMLISLPIHKDGGYMCKVLGDRFQGYGMGVSLPELTQGYGDHGMGARRLKIEENRAKCTEQVLQLEANLYAMPCPARCCWCRSPVNAAAWADSGSREDHFWWHLYQWRAWSCRGPWDAFLDGLMTLESSVTVASSDRCQWSFPHDVNPRSFHR